MLTLIVARAKNGAIGRDGDIPWHAPEDLKLFQRETLGGAILMGRRTWESLPIRPLKNRHNIVVTRSKISEAHQICSSPQEALAAGYAAGYTRIYGVGGASIYRELMPFAQRLVVTEVDLIIEDADTFFPEINPSEWKAVREFSVRSDAPKCRGVEYLRN